MYNNSSLIPKITTWQAVLVSRSNRNFYMIRPTLNPDGKRRSNDQRRLDSSNWIIYGRPVEDADAVYASRAGRLVTYGH